MDKVKLPVENAHEPGEEARQPIIKNQTLSDNNKLERQNVTFVESIKGGFPQNNSEYKNVLSQPPKNITHKQKLLWLQQRRTEGLWAQCDACDSWRYLPGVLDGHQLPAKWFCWMNPDKTSASCTAPEVPICLHDEEDLIHAEYAAGSLVLARMPGFPWWPAMVDDCPDTEQYYWLDGFSDIPTHYNVVFFDAFDVSRAWIAPEQLIPYKDNNNMLNQSLKRGKYKQRLNTAIIQANDAEKLTLAARLTKYSFIARFKGKIVSPKNVNKKEVKRHQNKLKRKFNVDFAVEFTDSEDEADYITENNKIKRKHGNKTTVTKIVQNDESKHTPIETGTEHFINNTSKDLNSLTVYMDSDSGLIKNNFFEASNNYNKEQGFNNSTELQVMKETLEDSQQSDDFDF